MQQHARVVLGEQGRIQRSAPGADMPEADLVGEDCFAGSGRSLDDEEAAANEAPADDCIQPRDTTWHPLQDRAHCLISGHLVRGLKQGVSR
jgi:hypothetical protein